MLLFLLALAWVGCGVHEIITDHQWWTENFKLSEPERWQPIDWRSRSSREALLMGPIACAVGYSYRAAVDRQWRR